MIPTFGSGLDDWRKEMLFPGMGNCMVVFGGMEEHGVGKAYWT